MSIIFCSFVLACCMNLNQPSNGVDDAIVVGNALDKPSNDPRHVECLNLVRNIYEQAFFQLKNAATYDEVLKIKKLINDYIENLEDDYRQELDDICKGRNSVYKSEYEEIVGLSSRFENEIETAIERVVAADLVGIRFIETTKDGFFKDKEWKFAADDKLTVKIAKVERVNDDVKFCVTIDLLTPTRGRYTIDGEVRYYHGDNGWVFDMFLGNSIMPQITNAYNNCITIKHKGWKGQRSLEFINHSNVKLGVYVSLKIWLKDEIHKGRVVVEPNEKKEIGGLFIGDVEEYTLHYIERY